MPQENVNLTDPDSFLASIASVQENSGGAFSILLVDVGDTGKITARFGDQATNFALQNVAGLLDQVRREGDRISRIGEKLFALLLVGIGDAEHAALAAAKIIRTQKEQSEGDESSLWLKFSIGIAICPTHSSNPATLLQKARIALEAAISSRQPWVTYSPDTEASLTSRWELQEEFRHAVEDGSLEMHYQPKIYTSSGTAAGAEALMRWTSEKQGPIAPEVFVSLADEIGVMEELSRFAINAAMRQAAEWPDIGVPLSVSVNLDSDTLQKSDVVEMVKSAVSIWGVSNRKLILEVTERTLMVDSEKSFNILEQLKSAGIGISIDDFGTGYSSLSYFKNIPATELKIDKSFVSNMFHESADRNIVETIVWLAHRFNLSVVAEGVEDIETLIMLGDMNCELLQGFFISKPLTQNDFCDWLTQQQAPNDSVG